MTPISSYVLKEMFDYAILSLTPISIMLAFAVYFEGGGIKQFIIALFSVVLIIVIISIPIYFVKLSREIDKREIILIGISNCLKEHRNWSYKNCERFMYERLNPFDDVYFE